MDDIEESIREHTHPSDAESQTANTSEAGMAKLESEVSGHCREIERLNEQLERLPTTDVCQVIAKHHAIKEFTLGMFEGDVDIHEECDPELPCSYFVVSAIASGDVEEIADLSHDWHVGVLEIASELAQHYRLSLDVR